MKKTLVAAAGAIALLRPSRNIQLFMLAMWTTLILLSVATMRLTSTGNLGMAHVLLLLPLDMAALTIPAIWWHQQQRHEERDAALVLPWIVFMVYMLRFPVLLCARLNRPLQDALFVRTDAALGISVPAMVAWTSRHPWADLSFSLGYNSLYVILLLAIFLPALLGKKRAAQEFLLSTSIAFLVALPFFALLPAVGPWAGYHLVPSNDQKLCEVSLLALRQSAHFADAHRLANSGIICFPSFHVLWAILAALALRPFKPLRMPAMILSALITISTMMTGWHYAADVVGGLVLAVLSAALAKAFLRLGEKSASRHPCASEKEAAFIAACQAN